MGDKQDTILYLSFQKLKYTVYDNYSGAVVKSDCTLIAMIPAGVCLSDDAVKSFFGVDETSLYWDRMHKSCEHQRLVFDKCVVPIIDRYRIEVARFD